MEMNNILISSAGKRGSLVNLFKQELAQFSPESKVIVTDANPAMAPASYLADSFFTVPRVNEVNFIDITLEICLENNVKIIVPTIDTELLSLAKNIELFKENGIDILVCDPEFIAICRDKRESSVFFDSHGIKVPRVIDIHKPLFPIFAKPFDGSLSKDIYIINNTSDITEEILSNPKLIFMEYINDKDYQEFTIDMYYGRDHKLKCIVPRQRLEVRAGEVNKAITRKNNIITEFKEKLDYIPGARGCLCMQAFYNEKTDDIIAIEINPRFGGGYPLTYHAGGNFQKFIIEEYFLNRDIDYFENWTDNTLMLRFDQEVIVNNGTRSF